MTARGIERITRELQTALKREAIDIVAIGRLLIEARAKLEHGEWLPWLAENFGSSISTADNYMVAARFAAKFPTVANLKLRPSALYMLGHDLEHPCGLFDRRAMRAILRAAKTQWISGDQARDIAEELQPPESSAAIRRRPRSRTGRAAGCRCCTASRD